MAGPTERWSRGDVIALLGLLLAVPPGVLGTVAFVDDWQDDEAAAQLTRASVASHLSTVARRIEDVTTDLEAAEAIGENVSGARVHLAAAQEHHDQARTAFNASRLGGAEQHLAAAEGELDEAEGHATSASLRYAGLPAWAWLSIVFAADAALAAAFLFLRRRRQRRSGRGPSVAE